MKRGSKRKTYKRKTYKRKTYKRKTYKRKTYKRKTYKKSNVKEINKKRKSKKRKLIGGSETIVDPLAEYESRDLCEERWRGEYRSKRDCQEKMKQYLIVKWERNPEILKKVAERIIEGGRRSRHSYLAPDRTRATHGGATAAPAVRRMSRAEKKAATERAKQDLIVVHARKAIRAAAKKAEEEKAKAEAEAAAAAAKQAEEEKAKAEAEAAAAALAEFQGADDVVAHRINDKEADFYKVGLRGQYFRVRYNDVKIADKNIRAYDRIPPEDLKALVLPHEPDKYRIPKGLTDDEKEKRRDGIQEWFNQLIILYETAAPPAGMSREDWIKMFVECLSIINFFNLNMTGINGNPLWATFQVRGEEREEREEREESKL